MASAGFGAAAAAATEFSVVELVRLGQWWLESFRA